MCNFCGKSSLYCCIWASRSSVICFLFSVFIETRVLLRAAKLPLTDCVSCASPLMKCRTGDLDRLSLGRAASSPRAYGEYVCTSTTSLKHLKREVQQRGQYGSGKARLACIIARGSFSLVST